MGIRHRFFGIAVVTIALAGFTTAASAQNAYLHAAGVGVHHHHGHSGSGTTLNFPAGSSFSSGGGYYGSGLSVGVVGPGFGGYYPGGYYLGSPYAYGPYGYYGYGGGVSGPLYGFPPAASLVGPNSFPGAAAGLNPPVVNQLLIAPVQKPTAKPEDLILHNPAGGNANGFGVLAAKPVGPERPNVPTSSRQAQERAHKYIDQGDVAFHQQKYGEALGAYKDASRTAADLADAYFRQAAAQVALARYDEAVAAIKFGLRLSPAWLERRFRFGALYGNDRLAKLSHLEALAEAATDRPSSDLLFLTGVMLYFDDAPERAEPFFERARQLAVGDASHIDLFLQAMHKTAPVEVAKPVIPAVHEPPQAPPGTTDI